MYGYNSFQSDDEAVKAAWSEVVNQYRRRADRVPNLVDTVKGYAVQEKDVLIGATEAPAAAGSRTTCFKRPVKRPERIID